jgi:alginate O-acetyltransferase complex protein AlgI
VTLAQLLVFSAFAPLARLWARAGVREWLMLAASVAAIYWLQPLTPIRYFDFWFPTAALALTVWTWAATRPGASAPLPGAARLRPATAPPAGSTVPTAAAGSAGNPAAAPAAAGENLATVITGLVVAGLVLVIGLLRYLGPVCCLTPSPPPMAGLVVSGLLLIAAVAALLFWRPAPAGWLNLGVLVLIALLVVTKLAPLGQAASAGLRGLSGQPADLALATDLRWLGFSYLSFRLMHVLRDRAAGRLPAVPLREFLTYALFFPAYTAGPIDRVERFVKDLRQSFRLDAETVLAGGARIALGVLKKFVLADSLALVALNAANAAQANATLWAWVLVYAYAWRLYWDFSGYSDIAIGLGRFFGIQLPENFDRPYTRQNLTVFWNSWHMTLSQWFRAYVFNPLTRALRARDLPVPVIILLTQLATMLLIGLWHGISLNFVIWGAWHGLGLFIHNRWADFTKPRAALLDTRPRLKQLAHLAGVVVTFHFVALGWVWFALPTPDLALGVFGRLFGLGGLH